MTLIVGGGYHGKSTLLRALERGVYPHVPGDGRERVVTRARRREDPRRGRPPRRAGRRLRLHRAPAGRARRAEAFSSEDASGSTSQAANIVEALEAGSRLLLLDEDTSATNFMVRDARMQALVAKEHEPITPFVDRVRELWEAHGVSTVLVMGGSGTTSTLADTVIEMRVVPAPRADRGGARASRARTRPAGRPRARRPSRCRRRARRCPGSLDASRGPARGARSPCTAASLEFGVERIDLRALEQLVDESQARAIGHVLELARRRFIDGTAGVRAILDAIDALLDERGLDVLDPLSERAPRHPGDYARPRRYEIAAALNRIRSLRDRDARRPAGGRPMRRAASPLLARRRRARRAASPRAPAARSSPTSPRPPRTSRSSSTQNVPLGDVAERCASAATGVDLIRFDSTHAQRRRRPIS